MKMNQISPYKAITMKDKMKDIPIIFGSEMVKAILDGRKTMTRRPIKKAWDGFTWAGAVHPAKISGWIAWWPGNVDPDFTKKAYDYGFPCPYAIGDRLWVRETWRLEMNSGFYDIRYKADNYYWDCGTQYHKLRNRKCWVWRPSIFMPRWASRITLEVVDVKDPERLISISLADVHAEGFLGFSHFFKYWDSLYTKKPEYQVEANPWVRLIEFRKFLKECT